MKVKTTQEIELEFTPYEVAEMFCTMDADEQAHFFSEIGEITKKQWASPFCFQLQAVTDSNYLQDTGRDVMKEIGLYSERN